MDHFGSLNYKSACGPSCKKECHQGRLSDMSQQQFGQVVKSAQDAVRGAYKSLNGAGFPRKQPGADKVVRDRPSSGLCWCRWFTLMKSAL